MIRIAYVTGGTVGAGHLVRGVAIGRAFARAGVDATFRMFGPPLPFPVAARLAYEEFPLDATAMRDPARARDSVIGRALAGFAPDVLVVDLYWGIVHHLLPMANCEAWLLVRSVPRAWFGGPPDTRWNAKRFQRIVGIEPMSNAAIRERVDPIVVCNPDELKPGGALRERLGVASDASLVVVTHAGTAGEIDSLARGATGPVVRCDLFDDDALFPLAEWLGDADRIIAGAGYNSFWEARWLDRADRTTFTPFARVIDDQRWRVATCSAYRMQANGADTLAGWIGGG
jgi:hypothetical protein